MMLVMHVGDSFLLQKNGPARLELRPRKVSKSGEKERIFGYRAARMTFLTIFGGDLASTRVMKPEVHAELQTTRKTDCKTLVANDDNYALAA
jgi:hypothetical protein